MQKINTIMNLNKIKFKQLCININFKLEIINELNVLINMHTLHTIIKNFHEN